MPSVLSTKKLSAAQKNTFCKAEISFVDYDAIKIEFIDFKVPKTVENAIFTSKNAVKSVFLKLKSAKTIKNCFCVGDNTASLLVKNGLKPVKIGQNSADLGQFIVKNHSQKCFVFFCGDNRRDELPAILKDEEISCEEVITYKTVLSPKHFNQDFDAVLFFSPSGVKSFIKNNDFGQKMAICIGKTTAAEVEKHTDTIAIAEVTTVESVIEKAVEMIAHTDADLIGFPPPADR